LSLAASTTGNPRNGGISGVKSEKCEKGSVMKENGIYGVGGKDLWFAKSKLMGWIRRNYSMTPHFETLKLGIKLAWRVFRCQTKIGKNHDCYGGAPFHPTVSKLIVSFANQPYIAISHFETNPIWYISVYWFLSLVQAVGFGHRPYCQMFHVSSSFKVVTLGYPLVN
jgi:hypothetical protein